MKDHLQRLITAAPGALPKINVIREYLQARTLQGLQDDGVFTRWAFLGGTALRFLYSIPRYSEDLDFSVLDPSREPGFRPALLRVRKMFEAEGYDVTVKTKADKTVASAFVRFPGLLHELGVSPHASQVISIKIEVDTKPPAGAESESTLVRRHVLVNLHHYNRPSLLAGKLHAVLSRRWTKGRDLYDVVWYLADRNWPEPNLALLNSALSQTGWQGHAVTADSWRDVLGEKLAAIDWEKARADVFPFLERPGDIDLMTMDNVTGLLEQTSGQARRGAAT